MIKEINYRTPRTFLGRNGMFKQSGIEVMTHSDGLGVRISPVTSKGQIGRAWIDIPWENLEETCKALNDAKNALWVKSVAGVEPPLVAFTEA